MDYFYYLYAFLIFYILKLFRELRNTYKLSSYTTLYKASLKDNVPFAIGILYIMFTTLITPAIVTGSIYMNFNSLRESLAGSLLEAGYTINIKTLDWLNILFKNNSGVLTITNTALMDIINHELTIFRIQSLILIVSALVVQAKVFDNNNLVVFEEGVLKKGKFYDWENIRFINNVTDNSCIKNTFKIPFSNKSYIHFEMELEENISRYNFFKSGNKVIPKEGLVNTYEKLNFKIPASNLPDFKSALRLVNAKSNLE